MYTVLLDKNYCIIFLNFYYCCCCYYRGMNLFRLKETILNQTKDFLSTNVWLKPVECSCSFRYPGVEIEYPSIEMALFKTQSWNELVDKKHVFKHLFCVKYMLNYVERFSIVFSSFIQANSTPYIPYMVTILPDSTINIVTLSKNLLVLETRSHKPVFIPLRSSRVAFIMVYLEHNGIFFVHYKCQEQAKIVG